MEIKDALHDKKMNGMKRHSESGESKIWRLVEWCFEKRNVWFCSKIQKMSQESGSGNNCQQESVGGVGNEDGTGDYTMRHNFRSYEEMSNSSGPRDWGRWLRKNTLIISEDRVERPRPECSPRTPRSAVGFELEEGLIMVWTFESLHIIFT